MKEGSEKEEGKEAKSEEEVSEESTRTRKKGRERERTKKSGQGKEERILPRQAQQISFNHNRASTVKSYSKRESQF